MSTRIDAELPQMKRKVERRQYRVEASLAERAKLVDFLLREFHTHYGANLTSCVLFGSTARGTCRPDSDIDVLVVCEVLPKEKLERIRDVIPVLEAARKYFENSFGKFPPYVSIILKSETEARFHSPLYLDILEDGKVLFDRDGFLSSVFEAMRKRLKVLEARRIWLGGHWYWDLKPSYRWGEEFAL